MPVAAVTKPQGTPFAMTLPGGRLYANWQPATGSGQPAAATPPVGSSDLLPQSAVKKSKQMRGNPKLNRVRCGLIAGGPVPTRRSAMRFWLLAGRTFAARVLVALSLVSSLAWALPCACGRQCRRRIGDGNRQRQSRPHSGGSSPGRNRRSAGHAGSRPQAHRATDEVHSRRAGRRGSGQRSDHQQGWHGADGGPRCRPTESRCHFYSQRRANAPRQNAGPQPHAWIRA